MTFAGLFYSAHGEVSMRLVTILLVPFALTGCTLLGIGGGKTLPPKPQESPQYVELLREHVDLARQAAERFDAEGAEPASPLTGANLAVVLAVQAVVGSPLYQQRLSEVVERPGSVANLGAKLKAERAAYVDQTAAWEQQVEDVRAKLQDAVRQNGVLARFTDTVTLWVRWAGAVVILIAAAAFAVVSYLKQQQVRAVLFALGGVAAVALWIWLAGMLVKVAVWALAVAALAAAGYGAYLLWTRYKVDSILDKQIRGIQVFRQTAPLESVEILEAKLDDVSNASMRGYVDARKEALKLPPAEAVP